MFFIFVHQKVAILKPENLSRGGINTFFLLMPTRRHAPVVGKRYCQRGGGLHKTPLFRLIGTKRHTKPCCHFVNPDSRKTPAPHSTLRRKRICTRHNIGKNRQRAYIPLARNGARIAYFPPDPDKDTDNRATQGRN